MTFRTVSRRLTAIALATAAATTMSVGAAHASLQPNGHVCQSGLCMAPPSPAQKAASEALAAAQAAYNHARSCPQPGPFSVIPAGCPRSSADWQKAQDDTAAQLQAAQAQSAQADADAQTPPDQQTQPDQQTPPPGVDCDVNPDDPACADPGVDCNANPDDPACADPGVDCDVNPDDPACADNAPAVQNDPVDLLPGFDQAALDQARADIAGMLDSLGMPDLGLPGFVGP